MRVVRYFLLATVLLVFGGAFASVFLVNSDSVRNQAEQALTDLLERDVRVERHQIKLGEVITLRLANVQVAAPDWALERTFAVIGHLEVDIAVTDLLQQPVRIRAIKLNGLTLNLEAREDGSATWLFGEPSASEQPRPAEPEPRPTLPFLVEDVQLKGIAVNLRTPESAPKHLKLNALQTLNGDVMNVELVGSLNDTNLNLALQASPLTHLINFGETRLSAAGNLGDIAVDGSVSVRDLLKPRRPELDLTLKGPSIEYLTDRLGITPISTGPLDVSASAHPDGEQMAFFVSGQFGEFMASLNGAFDDLRTLERGSITLAISGPSTARVGALVGQGGLPDLPFSIAGRATRAGKQLELDESRVTFGQVKLDAQGIIPDLTYPTQANLSAKLDLPDLGRLASHFGLPPQLDGTVNADVAVKAGEDSATVSGDIKSIYGAIKLSGKLIRNADLSGSTLTVSAANDDIDKLLRLLPTQDKETQAIEQAFEQTLKGPWQIESQIKVSANQYHIENGSFTLGDDRIGFSSDIDREQPANNLTFALEGNLGSLRQYLKHFVDDETLSLVPPGPLTLATRGNLKDSQLELQETQLSLAGLQGQLTASTNLDSGAASSTFRFSSDRPSNWIPAKLLPGEFNSGVLDLAFFADGALKYNDGTLSLTTNRLALGDNSLSGNIGLNPETNNLSVDVEFVSPDIFVFANEEMQLGNTPLPMTSDIKMEVRDGRLDIDQLEIRANDGTVFAAKGDLRYGDTFDGTDLDIDVNIASLQRLGILLGEQLPDAPLTAKAEMSGDHRRIAAKDFIITSGESTATGTLRVFNPDHPNFQLTLRSDLLDLRPFAPVAAAEVGKSDGLDPLEPTGDGRLIPDTPIDLSPLMEFDALVDIDIKRIVGHTRRLKDVAVDAEVKQGQLVIKNSTLTDEDAGTIQLSGFARPEGDISRIAVKVIGNDINMGFPATTPAEVAQLPRLDVEALLFGEAKTVRNLLAQGNGFVQISGGSGKAPTMSGGLLTNDVLAELVSLINPFRKEEQYTSIQCSALVASLEKGQISGSPLFTMVTDRLAIVSEAKIDLSTEKLFATFNTVPQKGLGLSATTALNPFVGVGGTLANPQMTVDPTGTLVEGGLAFFTGGLSILGKGLFDRMTTGADACDKALKSGSKSRAKIEGLYAEFQ